MTKYTIKDELKLIGSLIPLLRDKKLVDNKQLIDLIHELYDTQEDKRIGNVFKSQSRSR